MSKILICADLTNESIDLLKNKLKNKLWNANDEVHLVHGFAIQVYVDNFFVASYPTKEDSEAVSSSVVEVLTNFANELFQGVKPKLIIKCILSASPKEAVCDYAKENSFDEMIIGSRGLEGIKAFFTSSFAEYMLRHAPCDLTILRQK